MSPARRILPTVIPALAVGVLCSLVLIAVSAIANALESVWWTHLPSALGFDGTSKWWIVAVLTVTGILVAATIAFMPGHAGPDPSTTELVDAPLRAKVVPGLLVAVILMLAGGISLGPENPIMAINVAMFVVLGAKVFPKLNGKTWVTLSVAGTVGALFGTPIAAALLLSETIASNQDDDAAPLWDKLVTPMFAAGAGSVTTMMLAGPDLSISLPAYRGFELIDLVSGSVIAVVAALIGLVAVYLFPLVHKAFELMRHQWITVIVGGLALGLIGAAVGPIDMFKGLDQMRDLAADAGQYTAWGLVGLAVVKLISILIASASGFRGGRIFPALFAGVALGFAANAFVPAIPVSLAVSAAVLGMLMTVTRQGWLAIFMALVTVSDVALIPALTIIALPTWLVVTGRMEMLIPKARAIPV